MQVVFYLAIAIISRLVPHPANMTGVMSSTLLIARRTTVMKTVLSVLIMWLVTDATLAYSYGYVFFSAAALAHYLALAIITAVAWVYVNNQTQPTLSSSYITLILMCFSFWIVSNFFVWYASGIYSNTINGLVDCYLMALPFLRNMVFGESIYFLIATRLEKTFSARSSTQVTALNRQIGL